MHMSERPRDANLLGAVTLAVNDRCDPRPKRGRATAGRLRRHCKPRRLSRGEADRFAARPARAHALRRGARGGPPRRGAACPPAAGARSPLGGHGADARRASCGRPGACSARACAASRARRSDGAGAGRPGPPAREAAGDAHRWPCRRREHLPALRRRRVRSHSRPLPGDQRSGRRRAGRRRSGGLTSSATVAVG